MNKLTVYAPLRRIFVHPWDALLLFIVWAGVNGGLYWHYGVKVGYDSFRYLGYAQKIADGSGWYEPHNSWYISYVLFVLVVKGLFHTINSIVAVQVLIHGVAAVVLYRASYLLFASRSAALITALLYLAWPEVPMWNFFVMTEAWYVSLVCLVLYCIAKFDGSRKYWVIITGIVLLTFFSRPTGIAVLVAYGAFLISYYRTHLRKYRVLAYWMAIPLILLTYLLVNRMLGTFTLAENYVTGEIVYRASTLHNYPNQEWLLVTSDNPLYIPPDTLLPVPRLFAFVAHNPVYFAKLFLAKLFYFVSHLKPYYSWFHNIIIALVLYPLYFFLVQAFTSRDLAMPIKLFCAVFLGISTLSVSLTTLDWDGRFFMPLLPVVFLLGAVGYRGVWKTMYRKYDIHRYLPPNPITTTPNKRKHSSYYRSTLRDSGGR